ncbi:MAG: hypothetical protein NC110_05640, partial [Ruminococcus sp.]|nr:hypothetical protein [Ruminococcus sp.]
MKKSISTGTKKALAICLTIMMVITSCIFFAPSKFAADAACDHTYELTITTPATCEAEGAAVLECTKCGDTIDIVLPQHPGATRKFLSNTGITYPEHGVCDAREQVYCKDCGVLETHIVSKDTPHAFNKIMSSHISDCKEGGQIVLACSGCKEMLFINTAPQEHNPYDVIDKEATCTEAGRKYSYCPICQTPVSKYEEIPMIPHSFTNYVSNNDATCVADGTKTAVCDICDVKTDTITDEGSHLNVAHKPEVVPAVAATCSATGLTEGSKCSVCGEILTAQTATPIDTIHGHNYEKYFVEPTCTSNGYYREKCSLCNNDRSLGTAGSVPKLPHTPSDWIVDTESTCTTVGSKHTECTACHITLETAEIAMKEHTYTTVVTAPTCTEQGYTTYTCACGDTYIADYVDANGHTEVTDEAVAPTCTEAGKTEGRHCSVCGTVTVAQEVVEAKGHTEV